MGITNSIAEQFDQASRYMQAVAALDKIGDSSASVDEITQIIQTVEYLTNGNNPAFRELLGSAIGAKINGIVKTAVDKLVSDYQITVKDPYSDRYIPVQFASDDIKYAADGSVITDNTAFHGPVTLAIYDPNARIGFALIPDKNRDYDDRYAPWMPASGSRRSDGSYNPNSAEEKLRKNSDQRDNPGGCFDQNGSLIASYHSSHSSITDLIVVTTNASDFAKNLHLTPNKDAAADLKALQDLVG